MPRARKPKHNQLVLPGYAPPRSAPMRKAIAVYPSRRTSYGIVVPIPVDEHDQELRVKNYRVLQRTDGLYVALDEELPLGMQTLQVFPTRGQAWSLCLELAEA